MASGQPRLDITTLAFLAIRRRHMAFSLGPSLQGPRRVRNLARGQHSPEASIQVRCIVGVLVQHCATSYHSARYPSMVLYTEHNKTEIGKTSREKR